jgi:hypothetical protein
LRCFRRLAERRGGMLVSIMAKAYGKIPRTGSRKTPAPPAEILVRIRGRHTLEQITEQVQIMIARLQDQNVYGVQEFRVRCEPLDAKGKPVALRDAEGKPLAVLDIPAPETPPPPYRPATYEPVGDPSRSGPRFQREGEH